MLAAAGWCLCQSRILTQTQVRLLLERESDLERYLPVTNLAVLQLSAGFDYLKPTHVANGLFSASQGIFYRLFKSVGRRTNHLNLLVNVLGHVANIS